MEIKKITVNIYIVFYRIHSSLCHTLLWSSIGTIGSINNIFKYQITNVHLYY